jgi:DNA mismatch endonuclease Vsr
MGIELIRYLHNILLITAGWNKGKSLSEEHRQKISESLKGRIAWNKGMKLKPHSEETKQKIRVSHIGMGHTLETRAKLSQINLAKPLRYWLGKHRSEEDRLNMSKVRLGRYGGMKCYWYGKKRSLETIEKIRLKRLLQVTPKKNSSIELKLQNALTNVGISFKTHPALVGQPDIFIAPNICIFCDGNFWHGNPRFFDDTYVIVKGLTVKQRRDYDEYVSNKLTAEGYAVLRFWEYDIETNLQACVKTILSKVGERIIVKH